VREKTERNDGTFSVTDVRWDEQTNEYLCPRGEPSRSEWRRFKTPRSHVTQADTITYRSSQLTCASCPLKLRCCPNTPMRKIACSLHEQSRAVARRIADTAAYRQSRCTRRFPAGRRGSEPTTHGEERNADAGDRADQGLLSPPVPLRPPSAADIGTGIEAQEPAPRNLPPSSSTEQIQSRFRTLVNIDCAPASVSR